MERGGALMGTTPCAHRRQRIIKTRAAINADSISALIDREHATEVVVMTAEQIIDYPRQAFH